MLPTICRLAPLLLLCGAVADPSCDAEHAPGRPSCSATPAAGAPELAAVLGDALQDEQPALSALQVRARAATEGAEAESATPPPGTTGPPGEAQQKDCDSDSTNIDKVCPGKVDLSWDALATVLEGEEEEDGGKQPRRLAAMNTCTMSEQNRCPLSSLPIGQSTLIYPGGDTRCSFSTSGPYSFQVLPNPSGSLNLFIYFQKGGGCWNMATQYAPEVVCRKHLVPEPSFGIFDLHDPANPFKDYGFLIIQYCSGDLFAGNKVQSYADPAGNPVNQTGYANAKAALDWAKENGGTIVWDNLVIGGSSAGSMGAQIWSQKILGDFKYKNGYVIMDSFLGEFPPTIGKLYLDFGICQDAVWHDIFPKATQEQHEACVNGDLSVKELVKYCMSLYPNVKFLSVSSKTDILQVAFYNALAVTTGEFPNVTGLEFYKRASRLIEQWNEYENSATFVVSSSQHVFFDFPTFTSTYDTGVQGPLMAGIGSLFGQKKQSLASWLGDALRPSPATVKGVCPGWAISTVQIQSQTNVDWCLSNIVQKTLHGR